jgi:hypothetical protein
MVLRHYIKIISGTLIFLLMVILFSCEGIDLFINCSECTTEEPEIVYLDITVDARAGGSLISIYEGNLEDSVLYFRFMTYSKSAYYKVPLNRMLTLTARYQVDGNTYLAVNSVTPRVKYEEDRCTDPCYIIYDKSVDLKLKFAK